MRPSCSYQSGSTWCFIQLTRQLMRQPFTVARICTMMNGYNAVFFFTLALSQNWYTCKLQEAKCLTYVISFPTHEFNQNLFYIQLKIHIFRPSFSTLRRNHTVTHVSPYLFVTIMDIHDTQRTTAGSTRHFGTPKGLHLEPEGSSDNHCSLLRVSPSPVRQL